jgi:hypothetical protein
MRWVMAISPDSTAGPIPSSARLFGQQLQGPLEARRRDPGANKTCNQCGRAESPEILR